jgi:hypothetical protein
MPTQRLPLRAVALQEFVGQREARAAELLSVDQFER